MVRLTGLEPVPSRTRPSNVRVCLFRHNRKNKVYYTLKSMNCQVLTGGKKNITNNA